MSITLRAILIDVERYRHVQGSGDLALIQRIITDAAAEIAQDDSWAAQLRPDHLPLADALRDIAAGKFRAGRSAALSYQIAAVILAEHIGNRIDDDEIAELPEQVQPAIDNAITRLLDEADSPSGDWPRLADVLQRGPALDIPRVPETLPNGTGLVAEAEARRAAELISRIECADCDSAEELALTYGSWLVRAGEQSLSVLLVCS